jgi:Holliday junction resolvase
VTGAVWGSIFRRKRSSYSKGIDAERRVKSKLESKGWLVRQSKGSRGPYDLYAMKGGKKLFVQVKSGSASLSRTERTRLRRVAKKKGGKALLIKCKKGAIQSRIIY